MKIPLCKPYVGDEEIKLVNEVIKSGWLAHGPKTQEFERDFADYIGSKYATSLNSCTSALQLALESKSIKGEIILPSFTFVASANAVVNAGAKPIFVDIEFNTCNIDPQKIREKITNKTRAIMPVHFAGQSCRMDEIMEIAEKYNLEVIEDSAECIGGLFNGKKTGNFGIGCFSFFPTKNITTGEGGMITTNDEELAKKISALKAHGILTATHEREKKEKSWLRAGSYAGYNYRLCDILSAIGLVQLKKLDKMNDLRRRHAGYLSKNLENIDCLDLPVEEEKCKHVYQMYTIKVKNIDRTRFILKLRGKGVQASVHFDPPVHLQPYYLDSGWRKNELIMTEKVSQSIVTLPMYPQLTKGELDFIVKSIEETIKLCKK
jgi:perosamine synthetase